MLHQPANALTQKIQTPPPTLHETHDLTTWQLVMEPAQQKRDIVEYLLIHG